MIMGTQNKIWSSLWSLMDVQSLQCALNVQDERDKEF